MEQTLGFTTENCSTIPIIRGNRVLYIISLTLTPTKGGVDAPNCNIENIFIF